MTDKEMAEAYVREEVPFNITESGINLYIASDIEYAYLAGLRARKSKWHDLTKDPNDLPPVDPMYPECSVQVYSTEKVPIHYCFNTKEWVSELSYEVVNPIAWYHIPDYE